MNHTRNCQLPENSSVPELSRAFGLPMPKGEQLPFDDSEVEGTLRDRLLKIFKLVPQRTAIQERNRTISYQELASSAHKIANYIYEQGSEIEKSIGIYLPQNADILIAIAGITLAGRPYVVLDPLYPDEHTKAIAYDSDLELVLTNKHLIEQARKATLDSTPPLIPLENIASSPQTPSPDPCINSRSLAYIIYTSGSTGKPKGVMQNQRNVLSDILRQHHDLHVTVEDKLSLIHNCSSSSSVAQIFGAFLNGATLCPFELRESNLRELSTWLKLNNITIFDITVSAFRRLALSLTGNNPFPNLRLLAPDGEPLEKSEFETYCNYFSDNCILQNAYGSSEVRTATQFFVHKQSKNFLENNLIPIGYPATGKKILIWNKEGGEVPNGEIGEIVIKSNFLSPGYWKQDKETNNSFQFSNTDNAGIYFTGDLGKRLESGSIVHCGRKDFQTKIRGFRVEIAEIESQLNKLSYVRESAVIAYKNNIANDCLAAFIVPKSEELPVVSDIRSDLKSSLPGYMIPGTIRFLRTLPETLNGKLDRKSLISKLEVLRNKPLCPPLNEEEEKILSIWRDLLGTKEISCDDNFFDIGGDSLLALSLLDEIDRQLFKSLPLSILDELPTIKSLAKHVRKFEKRTQENTQTCVPLVNGDDPIPILIFPGRAQHLGSTHELILSLSPNLCCYGLKYRGMDMEGQPDTTIEIMAERLCQSIRETFLPDKKQLLFVGSSLGAIVAYETARLLHNINIHVAGLFVIDEPNPNVDKLLFMRLRKLWNRIKDNGLSENLRYVQDRFQFFAQSRRNTHLEKEKSINCSQAFESEKGISPKAWYLYMGDIQARAKMNYQPKKSDLPITLIRAAEQNNPIIGDDMGWGYLSTKPVRVIEIPGDHFLLHSKSPEIAQLIEEWRRSFKSIDDSLQPF